jgi:hypothetical protein
MMLLLMIPLSRPGEGAVFSENVRNLLHVPLFATVTFLLRFVQLSSPRDLRSLFVCALAAAFLGVLSEITQGMTGRTPAVGDLGADLSGILLACAVLARGSGRRLALLLAGGFFLAFAVRPLAAAVNATHAKREAFPKLLDTGRSSGLWQSQGATRLEVGEGTGLEVRMAGGSYEGLRYIVPTGVDTVGYSGLRIETANPGEAFELGVRIDGVGRQRQYESVVVPQGRSVLHTEWDTSHGDGVIVKVVLFTGEEQPARRFQLLAASLVREIPRTLQPDP